jgi:hypothetical protein
MVWCGGSVDRFEVIGGAIEVASYLLAIAKSRSLRKWDHAAS